MATTYDNASLVMIPSGVKEDKLYSIKPTDGSGDFTFSRGSDIQATRVNSSGLIEKAKENLLLQSNSFDTTWTNGNSTETSGQGGYDGSSDAWLLSRTGASGYIGQSISSSGVQSISVYAKAGTKNWIGIWVYTGSASNISYYDLSSGVVGSIAGTAGIGVTNDIESVGSGWYRCTFVISGSTTDTRIYVADADGDVSGTSGTIYIQDAQLNHGLVAQDYVETTTTAVVEGLTADLPRLDYSGGASCPSLLLEPSRTNLVAFSEYFNGSIWFQTGSSVTDNDAVSPEGVQNAAKVQGDGSQTYIRLYDDYTFSSTGNYTLSVFAKAGNNDFLRIQFGGVTGAQNAYFDLVNGTTEESWASIEPIGTDGWYRCSITADLTGPDLTGNYNFFPSYSYTTSTFPSAGDANGQYVYLYGAQLEQNATYETSYIPTYGTAANRGGEDCRKTGISSLLNDSEGTLFAEFEIIDESTTESYPISIYGTGATIQIYYRSTSQSISFLSSVGSIQYLYHSSVNPLGRHKVALVYQQGKYSAFIDGVLVNTQSSGNVPSEGTLNTLNFGDSGAGHFYGNANQLLVFPTALTDAEAIALTTI